MRIEGLYFGRDNVHRKVSFIHSFFSTQVYREYAGHVKF